MGVSSRVSFVLALVLAASCGKNDQPPAPSSGEPNSKPESGPSAAKRPGPGAKADRPGPAGPAGDAERLFATTCSNCHGKDGAGNGPAAEYLKPKPRNYTDATWQASVTDEDLKKIILLGGAGAGKSAMMPPNPGLKDRPEVVQELVKIIRGFGKRATP
jgi:cytochrome c553